MDTLAVVCDDNVECAEDRDEAQCKDGTDKYDPIVYAMTALMGLVYVVIKLHWFFYQRHQPVGDEEDDDMEMEEMDSSSNQDEEVKTAKLNQNQNIYFFRQWSEQRQKVFEKKKQKKKQAYKAYSRD